eukprot:3421254-Rhodomonas_salina.1
MGHARHGGRLRDNQWQQLCNNVSDQAHLVSHGVSTFRKDWCQGGAFDMQGSSQGLLLAGMHAQRRRSCLQLPG